jgi:hypothetical protein
METVGNFRLHGLHSFGSRFTARQFIAR